MLGQPAAKDVRQRDAPIIAIRLRRVCRLLLDAFYDRPNAISFNGNPLGGRADGQIANEKQYFGDFNPIWDVKVAQCEGGWTMGSVVPFKSLRYRAGREQIWGFNVERLVMWKNERRF